MKNLFKIMKERNISAYKLSADTHISQGNIGDWRHGRSSPTIPTLLKLSEYLNVSVDYLIDNPTIDKQRNSNEMISYISRKAKLSDDIVKAVLLYETEYLESTDSPTGNEKLT